MPLFEMTSRLRPLSRLLLAGLAAGMIGLAGCSSEEQKSEAPKPAQTDTAKTEPAKTEPAAADAAKTEPAAPAAATPATPAASTDTAATPAPAAPAAAAAPEAAKVEIPQAAGTVDVAKLMEPGPLKEEAIGKADAPITIVEYMSMTCPHCAAFHTQTFDAIKEKYVDTGKVRFILREFPLDPRAAAAIMLARCAPNDAYFPMVSMLFKQQRTWAIAEDGRDALLQMSKLAGFTQESFEACLTNQKLLDDVNAVKTKGSSDFGVDSTPTFFINGNRYPGAMSVEIMSALLDSML